jgi:phage-related protein (TIGR01555 family)
MGFLARFTDGLANIVSGLGTSSDRRMAGRYYVRPIGWYEIAAAYRTSWLIRKGVNLPPYDMTRAGRDWQADKATIAKLETEEKRLQIWAKVRLGLIYGRLGGGVIVLGVNEEDAAAPLTLNSITAGAFKYAVVLPRWQVQIGEKITDVLDPEYGNPAWYKIPGRNGLTTPVHPSRVIAFRGANVLPGIASTWEDEFWGDSILQAVEDAVKNADSAQNGFAALIEESKIDVYKIPGLTALAATAEFEKSLSTRMTTSNLFKSQFNALLLDAGDGSEGSGESWETRQLTWTGIPPIVQMYVSFVAGAFDIPATRFIGKSPDGMNATGASDENAYWSMVGSLQESDLRPVIDRIDAILIPSALGKPDPSVWWNFAPLRETTETEEAANFDKTTDALTKLQATETIPTIAFEKAVQNLMEERGWLPGLSDALADMPEDERFPSLDPANDTDPALDPSLEGGDPSAGGNGVPLRRAANDARFTDADPKTLYVSRKLLNTADFIKWAKGQGFDTTTPADDLHVTIAFSRQAIDWMKVGQDWSSDKDGKLTVSAGGPRIVQALGDKGAVVLLFQSNDLQWRHDAIKEAGASFDFDQYQPHVTITYQVPEGLDLAKVVPYAGPLVFGPELFAEVVDDWERGVTEE